MKRIPVTVEGLASLGYPDENERLKYQRLGIGQGDVPELIRIATDPAQFTVEEDNLGLAALHAWRALGQLKAVHAVGPLLKLLGHLREEEDDWLVDEMPEVLAGMGRAALPELTAFLADRSQGSAPRSVVADALGFLGQYHPRARRMRGRPEPPTGANLAAGARCGPE